MNNYERITSAVAAMIAGDVPTWRRPWRTLRESGAATLPRNAITGRCYNGINTCLLWTRQDADMRYLTYRQAAEHGGHVRKGEHGQHVVFWQKRQYTTRDESGAEEVRNSLLLKVYTVFNIAQCDDVRLPGASKGPAPLPPPPVMLEVYDKAGATVEHGGDRACYVPSRDKILMPRPEAFTSADAYAATGLHELTHWTGHGSRLDRVGTWGKRFGDRAYAAEELVAELGSAFLCAALGVNSALEHHASYIASWRDLLAHDARAVFTASSKAQAAANWILAKVRRPAHPRRRLGWTRGRPHRVDPAGPLVARAARGAD